MAKRKAAAASAGGTLGQTTTASSAQDKQDRVDDWIEAAETSAEGGPNALLPPEDAPAEGDSMTYGELQTLAFQLWEKRGSPAGSPELDWAEAIRLTRIPKQ